jgi:glucoamylase
VWAHAEYLKLCRSLRDGEIFDRPPQTVERYLEGKTTSHRVTWRFNHQVRSMPARKTLRVETLAPALVHWSSDGWRTAHDATTRDTSLGIHVVDLDTAHLGAGARIDMAFYWTESDRWEGTDYHVCVE